MAGPLQATTARAAELGTVFALLFQHLPPEDRRERIARAMDLVRRGELDPGRAFVVRGAGTVWGAILCLPIPGASALVWPPRVRSALQDRGDIEDCLVRAAIAWMRHRGVKLAQALLSADEDTLSAPLQRSGFEHVTCLWYMRHLLAAVPRPAQELCYTTYENCDRAVYHETLLQTYVDTLDCPEIGGVRTVEEIMEGHRGQGPYDPSRWWLASKDGAPVGVLLLAEVPDSLGMDLTYLGVVPGARRRGIGRALASKAIAEAAARGASQLTLAVDDRNGPAWALYRDMGFEPYERREVYLRLLARDAAIATDGAR